jgi:hypothetical protein
MTIINIFNQTNFISKFLKSCTHLSQIESHCFSQTTNFEWPTKIQRNRPIPTRISIKKFQFQNLQNFSSEIPKIDLDLSTKAFQKKCWAKSDSNIFSESAEFILFLGIATKNQYQLAPFCAFLLIDENKETSAKFELWNTGSEKNIEKTDFLKTTLKNWFCKKIILLVQIR